MNNFHNIILEKGAGGAFFDTLNPAYFQAGSFLFCKLAVIKVSVETALCKQLIVAALFDNAAVLHNKDYVRIAYG